MTRLTDKLANWLTNSLANWLADWLTGWLTDWLTHWLADWLADLHTEWLSDLWEEWQMLGTIHSTKISRNWGPKLNGSVRSNRKSFQISGPPFEEVLFSWSDRSEFWLNGSCPLFLKQSWPKMLIVVDLWCWTCKLTFWSFEPTDFF